MRDAPGRGRKVTVTADADACMRTLLATPPPAGRWTVRSLATAMGISRASVHRVLKAGKLTLTGLKVRRVQERSSHSQHDTPSESALN